MSQYRDKILEPLLYCLFDKTYLLYCVAPPLNIYLLPIANEGYTDNTDTMSSIIYRYYIAQCTVGDFTGRDIMKNEKSIRFKIKLCDNHYTILQ